MITEDPVYIYITCGRVKKPSALQLSITSKLFAALQSIPVKKFFEWEYG